MEPEVRLRDGAETILQRPISDAEFTRFDAIYAATSGSVDERLNASFGTIAADSIADGARIVTSYYQVFYGRQPDAGGLDFWTDQLDSGAETLNSLADKFAAASEYNSRFGDQQPVEVVATLYANVLGRAADAEGLAFWTNQVQSGNLSLADLGRFFATSDEAQARFDPFIDNLLVDAANGTPSYDPSQSLFQQELGGGTGVTPGTPIDIGAANGSVVGTADNDRFQAESGDLSSGSRIDGGAGDDTLEVFNESQGNAISPRMTGVETVVWTEQTNDRFSDADNNVGGYSVLGDTTTEVDVELDAGRISGVTRWEDFDSRADLVIEDARDADDTDGTFTGDLEVAMVSTDSGNVDYAIYFDDPVNLPPEDTATVLLEVLDLDTANTTVATAVNANTPGVLNDATLSQFTLRFNGDPVTIVLFDREAAINETVPAPAGVVGPTATYGTLITAVQTAIDANATLAGQGLVVSLGGVFDETASPQNDVGAGSTIFGRQVQITAPVGNTLEAVSRVAFSDDPSRAIAARITDEVNTGEEELIRINVDLDDVGKGSMGGDLMIGAMSTGRQIGDDGTSDSQGIQQFDIEVDRSSQLQTINSTNNALEVVTIVNGENDNVLTNTTTASDEQTGDLVVRGRANPDGNVATDNDMPGARPQHNDFGFSDVRQIDASAMIGNVDLTAELTDEIVEKYLDTNDTVTNGNLDDVTFDYDLGTGNDEFLINLSASALIDAGSASREDFNLDIDGNAGNDVIVTNVGTADKLIDDQGQDFYDMTTNGGWFANQAARAAASISVDGDAGDDSIWTHGWGNASISAGTGNDVVYTDNEGTVNVSDTGVDLFDNLNRNVGEDTQIDYEVGAVWTFNDNGTDDGIIANIVGSTNDLIRVLPNDPAANSTVEVTVSFRGGDDDDDNAFYTSTVTIPRSSIPTTGSANGQVTEQELNQAIKRAINDLNTTDANGVLQLNALNKVLEAVDGPGQSLAVYSKIDGDFSSNDLQITANQVVGTTATAIALGDSYDTSGAGTTSDFQNFGGVSSAESDNVIVVTGDDASDVTVLSTGANSDEDIVFLEGTFGTETVFNFEDGNVAGTETGTDRFDFREINVGTFSNGVSTADDSVSVIAEAANNDTAADIGTLFRDDANTVLTEKIAIIYDTDDNNTGRVYLVTDSAGGSAVTVDILGDIELIGTDWANLDADNFFG